MRHELTGDLEQKKTKAYPKYAKTCIFQVIYSLIHYLPLPTVGEPSDRYCLFTLEWTIKADV